jgi:hypothetical protein
MSDRPISVSGQDTLERTQRNERRAQQRRLDSRLRHYDALALTQGSSGNESVNLDFYPPLPEPLSTATEAEGESNTTGGVAPQTPQALTRTESVLSSTPTTAGPTRPISGSWRIVVRETAELVFIRHLPGQCQEWLTASETATGEWEIFHTQETPDPLQLEFPS